ncbi:MAG: galactose-phosphate uridylyltransferase [Cryobacterium sp.]|nr:galactose-phosphate uridylyltransferase [Cryobacterium sp.]
MTIEHDFFGILGSDDEGEVYWSDQAELGDQGIDIDLSAPDEESVSVEALDIAASMIGALEELDSRAKESLVAELSTEGSPTLQYIQLALDEIGADSLEDAIIWDSGDKQIDFLRSLQLQRVGFRPHHTGDEQHFAVMDYSISPDDTDSLLVVSLDVNGDTVSVALES